MKRCNDPSEELFTLFRQKNPILIQAETKTVPKAGAKTIALMEEAVRGRVCFSAEVRETIAWTRLLTNILKFFSVIGSFVRTLNQTRGKYEFQSRSIWFQFEFKKVGCSLPLDLSPAGLLGIGQRRQRA